jgi:hypothetical protein
MTHKRSTRQHDPAEIAKHDDVGKDRLFEGREQHDEADKNSEKNRLARDVARPQARGGSAGVGFWHVAHGEAQRLIAGRAPPN